MKLLSESQFREWTIATGWLACSDRSVEPVVPAVSYTGGCDTDGYAASDVAEFLLRGVADGSGRSGALWVCDTFPPDGPPLEVFRHLTTSFGAPAAAPSAWRFEFCGEPGSALCAVSWCLACGWGFCFVHRPALCFVTSNDDRLRVYLGRDQRMKPDAEAWLFNCGFEKAAVSPSLG